MAPDTGDLARRRGWPIRRLFERAVGADDRVLHVRWLEHGDDAFVAGTEAIKAILTFHRGRSPKHHASTGLDRRDPELALALGGGAATGASAHGDGDVLVED